MRSYWEKMGRLGKGPSRIIAMSRYKPELHPHLQARMQRLSLARPGHRELGKSTESKKDVPKTEWPWGEGQFHAGRRGSPGWWLAPTWANTAEGRSQLVPSVYFPPVTLSYPSPVDAVGLGLPLLSSATAGFSQKSTELIISTNKSGEAK